MRQVAIHVTKMRFLARHVFYLIYMQAYELLYHDKKHATSYEISWHIEKSDLQMCDLLVQRSHCRDGASEISILYDGLLCYFMINTFQLP